MYARRTVCCSSSKVDAWCGWWWGWPRVGLIILLQEAATSPPVQALPKYSRPWQSVGPCLPDFHDWLGGSNSLRSFPHTWTLTYVIGPQLPRKLEQSICSRSGVDIPCVSTYLPLNIIWLTCLVVESPYSAHGNVQLDCFPSTCTQKIKSQTDQKGYCTANPRLRTKSSNPDLLELFLCDPFLTFFKLTFQITSEQK